MFHDNHSALPLKIIFSGLIALGLVVGNTGFATVATAKSAKKTMTGAQKAELRKKGREWCKKNFIQGGAYIVRVEIMNDGRVRCWYKS